MPGRLGRIGITGGIAAGKSTVSRLFGELGGEVIDADQLARHVTAPGSPTLEQLRQTFGRGVLDDAGRLDRPALAKIVFGDPAARRRLEAITHPAIIALAEERFAALARLGCSMVFYEAALLVETGRHLDMDRLVVVRADDELRIRRMKERDGLDLDQARRRLSSQLPQADKEQLADYVIDNSGALKQTRAQVEAIWSRLSATDWQEVE